MVTSTASLINWSKYFLTDTTNSMSHTLKVTAMEISVIANSASLFPCLDFMDNS